jgi:hypothetical protein
MVGAIDAVGLVRRMHPRRLVIVSNREERGRAELLILGLRPRGWTKRRREASK